MNWRTVLLFIFEQQDPKKPKLKPVQLLKRPADANPKKPLVCPLPGSISPSKKTSAVAPPAGSKSTFQHKGTAVTILIGNYTDSAVEHLSRTLKSAALNETIKYKTLEIPKSRSPHIIAKEIIKLKLFWFNKWCIYTLK